MTTFRRLLVAVFAVACVSKAPPSAHRVLTPDAEPLRTAFNANAGKVRIVELVSPS